MNPDTGGQGQHVGGDGVIREYLWRKSLMLSVLTERRVFSPYGLNGRLVLIKNRDLDKREYLMIIFLISHQNHML